MAENSSIEWTDHTANFWWGCFKVSPGCAHCYADTWASRWGKDIWGPPVTTDREPKKSVWSNVRKWNREAKETGHRKKVFCMSMGDFFENHPQVIAIRDQALALISECKYLDWQILTKRPENVNRMIEDSLGYVYAETWFKDNPHVWIGTSVENQEQANRRIPELLKIPAKVRFLSMEPLLGPVNLTGFASPLWGRLPPSAFIHWVIVGGESGHNARPLHPDWVRLIRDQCVNASIPYFFKQWGEFRPNEFTSEVSGENFCTYSKVGKKATGRLLDGREWSQFPQVQMELL